ncbi:MAG: hypothetical protein FWE86_01720, partial [Oscillospiraceae bacterium]|nr:hypothetical protein [Oscillospiraceae bacterium]
MSFSSKKTLAGILAGSLTVIAYIIYAFSKKAPPPDDLKAWAAAMLIFIGIGVGVVIVIQILLHIVFAVGVSVAERGKDDSIIGRIISSETTEDERDKLVALKASRINSISAGIGFVAGLIALASGASSIIALHIILGSC